MKYAELVGDFNLINGYRAPAAPHPITNPEFIILRLRLMMEELSETAIALHERNLVEAADGLVDLMYVTVGTLVDMGLGPIMDDLFFEVHKANMSKDFLDKGDGRKGGFKGMKYRPPDLTHIIVEQIRKVTGQEPRGWNK